MLRRSTLFSLVLCVPTIGVFAQLTLLDPTFGNNGLVFVGLSGVGGDLAEDARVLSDGHIVVAGTRGGPDGALVALRLLQNGTLDNAFSGNGVALADMNVPAEGKALAVQADGKLVVAGSAEYPGSFDDLAFVRFTADGDLDTSFSGDGRFTMTHSGASDAVLSLAVQADGRIVGGGKFDGTVTDMMAVRLNANGTLDPTFATNGVFSSGQHTGEVAEDMVLRADGHILLAGAWRLTLPDADMALLQLDTDGTTDAGFGTNGLFRPSEAVTTSAVVSAVELSDGRVLIAGKRYVPGGNPEETFTGRVTAAGAWDDTYGTGGRSFLSLGTGYSGQLRDMVLLADGKALLTLDVLNGDDDQFVMALRVMPDGGLDPTFGTGGRVVMPCPGSGCNINALTLDAEQKVIAVGSYGTIHGPEMMIMRWLTEASGVGVAEAPINDGLQVYPVPCTDELRVSMSGPLGAEARFQLMDPAGRCVLEIPFHGEGTYQLPSTLVNGAYVLRMISDQRVSDQRVIVQR